MWKAHLLVTGLLLLAASIGCSMLSTSLFPFPVYLDQAIGGVVTSQTINSGYVEKHISASNSCVSLLHLSLQSVFQEPYFWLFYSISKPWLCHFSQVPLSVTVSSYGIHNQEEKITTWQVTLTLVWQYDVVGHWLVYKSNLKEKWCWRHWGVIKTKVWKRRTNKNKDN